MTTITDPTRMLPSRQYWETPTTTTLVASPVYAGHRIDLYRTDSRYCGGPMQTSYWAALPATLAARRRSSPKTWDTLHLARLDAMQAAGVATPYRPQWADHEAAEEAHRRQYNQTERLRTSMILRSEQLRRSINGVLSCDHLRADQYIETLSCREWGCSWCAPRPLAEALAILTARRDRRRARAIAEEARTGAPGRYSLRGPLGAAARKRRIDAARPLAEALAGLLHECRPLYESAHGSIVWGSTGAMPQSAYGIYSKDWHRRYGPARWQNAGVTVDEDIRIGVWDHRGKLVYRSRPITAADVADADHRGRAAMILGACPTSALDAVGPQGEDDAVQIRRPYLIHHSLLGLIIADHPSLPTIVQIVVRDTTTGQRHHLTVPPRFGRPLKTDKHETPYDRCRAAIAWTFGLAPSKYRPSVEA